MEPINQQIPLTQESLPTEEQGPSPDGWNGFFAHFSSDERKQFISSMSHQIGMMIQKQLRKTRENLQKLRSY